jgi:hypothetical protein
LIIGGVSAYFVIDSQNIDTHFIIDGTSISTDDYLDFRLVDSNNESVAGQRVYAELVSADGESKNYTLSSDEKGIVTISDKLDEGNYTISARFEGGDGYKSCEFKDIKISVYKNKVKKITTINCFKFFTKEVRINFIITIWYFFRFFKLNSFYIFSLF